MASGEQQPQQTVTQGDGGSGVPSFLLLHTTSSASGAARPNSSSRVASRKINKGISVLKIPENESPVLHSCVLRLRVEDRFLAEDVRESLDPPTDRFVTSHLAAAASEAEDLITSATSTPRPVSPSPLGTSTRSASHSPPPPPLVWETRRILNPALNLPSSPPFHLPKNSATSILQH
ncbi:unnamed protein product [Sphagnum troendelagicum]|jgi:hypothetical protein